MKNDNKNNKKYIDDDEGIKIVRRTISSKVESGIVIAANTDKNGSLSDSFVFAKGSVLDAFSMMTTALISMLDDGGVSLDDYIKWLQRVSDERKNK